MSASWTIHSNGGRRSSWAGYTFQYSSWIKSSTMLWCKIKERCGNCIAHLLIRVEFENSVDASILLGFPRIKKSWLVINCAAIKCAYIVVSRIELDIVPWLGGKLCTMKQRLSREVKDSSEPNNWNPLLTGLSISAFNSYSRTYASTSSASFIANSVPLVSGIVASWKFETTNCHLLPHIIARRHSTCAELLWLFSTCARDSGYAHVPIFRSAFISSPDADSQVISLIMAIPTLHVKDGIATIQLNRPESYNALTSQGIHNTSSWRQVT